MTVFGPLAAVDDVLFDFDGTLVDSSPLHARAFRFALSALAPAVLERFRYEEIKGLETAEAIRRLGISDAAVVAELAATKRAELRRLVSSGELEPLPGAFELLEHLKARGIGCYLVTSGSAGSVEVSLRAAGLRRFFAGIVTADDVVRAKPWPDPFLTALERFGLTRERTVVVEDAPSGIDAARAAGLRVIGVHDETIASMVDAFYRSLSQLDAAFDALHETGPRS